MFPAGHSKSTRGCFSVRLSQGRTGTLISVEGVGYYPTDGQTRVKQVDGVNLPDGESELVSERH